MYYTQNQHIHIHTHTHTHTQRTQHTTISNFSMRIGDHIAIIREFIIQINLKHFKI